MRLSHPLTRMVLTPAPITFCDTRASQPHGTFRKAMHTRRPLILFALFVALFIQSATVPGSVVAQNKTIPAPADVLGFTPGDDRNWRAGPK
jgi:hypothetical protein